MSRDPPDSSAEEPDGGNLHVRFRGGPGRGNPPGLLNIGLCVRAAGSQPDFYHEIDPGGPAAPDWFPAAARCEQGTAYNGHSGCTC
jgi:hypothetical protein